jgi:8-oxo-dGTP diphosphatase
MTRLDVDSELFLSPIGDEDLDALVRLLNVKEIYDSTLQIPHPYTIDDARAYLTRVREIRAASGKETQFAIRRGHGMLVGGIGFHGQHPLTPHRAEVGYWVAREEWGRGIASRALSRFCRHGQGELGYYRIEAPIYAFNRASQRVAEKCGFVCEGTLRKAYLKNGVFVDAKLYALVL